MFVANASYLFSLTGVFCCYSLIGEPIPEWSVYQQSASFRLTSTHYQRVYALFLLGIALQLSPENYLYFLGLFWLLLVLGLLSNPFVILLYFME